MGDYLALFEHLNLSPVNTALLVLLGLFVRAAVKSIFDRIGKSEKCIQLSERKNRRQDWAIRRIEQHLELHPITYDDED